MTLQAPRRTLSVRLGFDPQFIRIFVAVVCAVPAVLLAYDALRGHLPANAVNFVIRTLGLVGLIMLTLSLVVTPLRRMTGWNLLLASRRSLGLAGFFYIAAHFLVFFWFDRAHNVSSTIEEILKRLYLTIGATALILMIPLAVTSTDTMVSRLGAKRWKLLHRLAYVVVVLGVVHFWLLVKSDIRQPRAFAVVAGVLLLGRLIWHYIDLRRQVRAVKLARPVVAMRPTHWAGELTVVRVFDETPDVRTFRLAPARGGDLSFDYKPGQYLNLALMIDGKPVRRSYTIASSPTRVGSVEITVKRAVYGSVHLHDTWQQGSVVRVSAPAGKFCFTGSESNRIVLLAGGVGITPLMSIVRAMTDRSWPGQMHLVYSVRRPADVIFAEELEYLAHRFPNLHLCITASGVVEGAWIGKRGRIDAALLIAEVPDIADTLVYICGPQPMIDGMRPILASLGVRDSAVFTEAFVSPATPSPGAVTADAAGDMADPDDEVGIAIDFVRSGGRVPVVGSQTVLEVAEAAGITLPFECRSGICGQCKVRLVTGRVSMDAVDALTAADRANNVILACQAHARTALSIDA